MRSRHGSIAILDFVLRTLVPCNLSAASQSSHFDPSPVQATQYCVVPDDSTRAPRTSWEISQPRLRHMNVPASCFASCPGKSRLVAILGISIFLHLPSRLAVASNTTTKEGARGGYKKKVQRSFGTLSVQGCECDLVRGRYNPPPPSCLGAP